MQKSVLPPTFKKLPWWQFLLDMCWPRFCSGCQTPIYKKRQSCFCVDCQQTLIPLDLETACPVCACPWPEPEKHSFHQRIRLCYDCQRLRPSFKKITCVYQYGGALVNALHQFKWEGRNDLAEPLAQELVPLFLRCAKRCDLVLSVPLHRRRLVHRGYNQSALLAKMAHQLSESSVPIFHNVLYRKMFSAPMGHKTPNDRILRIQNAFSVYSWRQSKIKGRKILVLDDVVTTGATAQACTDALIKAGAASVEILALCRAV